MTRQLAEALTKRGRTWGQQNIAVRKAVRSGTAKSRRFSFRFRVGSPCGGCYVTRIPGAP